MTIVNVDVLSCMPLVSLFFVIQCSLFLCMHYSGFCAITMREKRASIRGRSGLGDAEEASVMFERASRTAAASQCHDFLSSISACVRKQRGEMWELCIGPGLTTVCT